MSDLLYVPFRFDTLGTQITYFAAEEPYTQGIMSLPAAASRIRTVPGPVKSHDESLTVI
jgi:hypothetical protein